MWGQAPKRTSFLPRFRRVLRRYLPRIVCRGRRYSYPLCSGLRTMWGQAPKRAARGVCCMTQEDNRQSQVWTRQTLPMPSRGLLGVLIGLPSPATAISMPACLAVLNKSAGGTVPLAIIAGYNIDRQGLFSRLQCVSCHVTSTRLSNSDCFLQLSTNPVQKETSKSVRISIAYEIVRYEKFRKCILDSS